VDLADVIIKWELQRVKEDQDAEVSELLKVASRLVREEKIPRPSGSILLQKNIT
jgi:hypothetical protein